MLKRFKIVLVYTAICSVLVGFTSDDNRMTSDILATGTDAVCSDKSLDYISPCAGDDCMIEPTIEETVCLIIEQPLKCGLQEPTIEPLVCEIEEPQPETVLTDAEIDLLAMVVMAEAEGESEEGKRLVVDTILNRVDHGRFPNTVYDVIYQSGQFECMWNGRINRCYVKDDIKQLVIDELKRRSNHDVIFFMAGGYSAYGTPLFQVGNHYFSSYN